MCHRNKMIFLGCILAAAIVFVICIGIYTFYRKPQPVDGTFVQAFRQAGGRCIL